MRAAAEELFAYCTSVVTWVVAVPDEFRGNAMPDLNRAGFRRRHIHAPIDLCASGGSVRKCLTARCGLTRPSTPFFYGSLLQLYIHTLDFCPGERVSLH